jgi:hypothetical protein
MVKTYQAWKGLCRVRVGESYCPCSTMMEAVRVVRLNATVSSKVVEFCRQALKELYGCQGCLAERLILP